MTDSNNEVLYVAVIGVSANLLLFILTFLISACKKNRNTDIEAFYEEQYYNDNDINVSLLKNDRIVDLIPSIKYLKSSNTDWVVGCSICLRDGFEEGELCKKLPGCDHVFHSACIDEWFKKSFSCPVCRKDFKILLVSGV